MRKLRRVILFFFILLFPLLTLACSQQNEYPIDYEQLSEEERLVIRFSHVVGEDTPKGMAARKFADLLKERSNGRIEVRVFSNGTLYKDVEELDALKRGDVQIIAPAISKLTHLVPELSVYDLPFAFDSLEEVHAYTESEAGKKLQNQLKKHNLLAIGLWDSGFKQISNDIRPIEHYNDLKGIRIRIMQSDILAKQYQIVDAFPRKIDFNTVFQSLKKGDVEGQENTLTNITSINLYS
ncbi:MAG: DctP family TRAP transporter solute-binding subunit, partial [Lysinibacillus sp.]|nr:DctP family TRAP transporter solute-binding subunit [Lysinibacillus sp.]